MGSLVDLTRRVVLVACFTAAVCAAYTEAATTGRISPDPGARSQNARAVPGA